MSLGIRLAVQFSLQSNESGLYAPIGFKDSVVAFRGMRI